MELIKKITKAGNSSNVLLPKGWLGGTARVELIEKPLNTTEDILRILSPYLKNILGIYLVGSHARGEETERSDVDVLVITNNLNKKIKKGRYEMILISEQILRERLERNILPILPMLKEAKAIMNEGLLEKYKNIMPNKKNLKWIIDITKSAQKMNKILISMSEENENISDGIAYSLILGLRTVYIIDCLKKNKIPTSKGLKNLVFKLTKTEEPYHAYLRSKNNKPDAESISPDIAEKLNEYVIGRLNE